MQGAPRSGCPINAAVEVLGDSWAMLVLRDIMFGNRRYFRELLAGSEEGIASNILSSRLKQLTAAGLLTREDAHRGQRAMYSLAEAGIQVLPIMVALGNWGLAYREGSQRLRVRAELLRDSGPDLVAGLMDELLSSTSASRDQSPPRRARANGSKPSTTTPCAQGRRPELPGDRSWWFSISGTVFDEQRWALGDRSVLCFAHAAANLGQMVGSVQGIGTGTPKQS